MLIMKSKKKESGKAALALLIRLREADLKDVLRQWKENGNSSKNQINQEKKDMLDEFTDRVG